MSEMDWATFFKDNSQSIFTLGGVFLGSFITFLISYLNNRFEAKERDKDREEARKEAKTQLSLELMRNDVKIIEDLIDDTLTSLNQVLTLTATWTGEDLSDSEIRERVNKEFHAVDDKSKGGLVADKLAYALGHEFSSEYESFTGLVVDVFEKFDDFEREHFPMEHINRQYKQIVYQAATLHNMLQDKLISIKE